MEGGPSDGDLKGAVIGQEGRGGGSGAGAPSRVFSVTGEHLLIPLNENLSQLCVFPHLQRRTVNTIRSVTSDPVTL